MAKTQAKYFQFEPAAFMSDIDFMSMTAAERGCYCTIIFCLYCNGGRIENDLATLAKICNVNLNFDFTFILKKFKNQNGFLTHKKVSEVIKKTQVIRNERVKAGKIGGKTRKQMISKCLANDTDLIKLSKVKLSKDNNNIYTPLQATQIFEKSEGVSGKFTIDECRGKSLLVGITEQQAESFFHHYNAQGWISGNGVPIVDLASAMVKWKNNQFRFEGKKEKSGFKTIQERIDENNEKVINEVFNVSK